MSDVRKRVERLESQSKQELKDLLGTELGDAYPREITDSLRNDFMRTCYNAIEQDRSPLDLLEDHPEYSPSWQAWGTKRQLATALRMALTRYVDRPQSQGLTGLDKRALAELVLAVRLSKGGTEFAGETNGSDHPKSSIEPSVPARTPPPESPFEDVFPANQFESYALYRWITAHRNQTDGEHGVYVLDCTPPVDGEERARLTSLRQQAHKKVESGESLSKRERAAQAVTDGRRIYYVGYASDVPVRVRQHRNGRAAGGADFTNMFKPIDLVEVSWYESETIARKHESKRARDLTVPGESYAYWE